ADFADELYKRGGLFEKRIQHILKVRLLFGVDVAGDLQSHSGPPRDLDRLFHAFVRRHPSQKSKVLVRSVVELVQLAREPVINGREPVRVGKSLALVFRDRNNRHFGVLGEQRREIGNVKPSVKSGDACTAMKPQKRKVDVVAVKMNDVKA